MSFTDPLSITISGSAISLPRISVGDDESEYRSGDGLTAIRASHTYAKRIRRMARLDTRKMAPDAFRPAENVEVSTSVYVVFDLPVSGYTPAEALANWVGFNALLSASSNAMLTKLLGGES
jgi:hypothetical protein